MHMKIIWIELTDLKFLMLILFYLMLQQRIKKWHLATLRENPLLFVIPPHTIWTSVFNFTDRDPGRLMLNEVNILHLRHFIGAQR